MPLDFIDFDFFMIQWANSIGFFMLVKLVTAPHFKFLPSIIAASISLIPEFEKTDPLPALNSRESSRILITSTTTSVPFTPFSNNLCPSETALFKTVMYAFSSSSLNEFLIILPKKPPDFVGRPYIFIQKLSEEINLTTNCSDSWISRNSVAEYKDVKVSWLWSSIKVAIPTINSLLLVFCFEYNLSPTVDYIEI